MSFSQFAKEVVDEVVEDKRPLIVLKNPNNRSIDSLISELRKSVELRGKSLKVVSKDSPELRSLTSLNGIVYLAIDNEYKPENKDYLIDVDWVFNNYEIN